jgi:DNA-binding transcriptional MerR regulator
MTLQELCNRSGIPVRTIRFYITSRLLPGPEGRGTSTQYTEEHLLKLLLIRKLTLLRLPLAEIRERLEKIGSADLTQLLKETNSINESESRTRSPKEYISSMLARSQLHGTGTPMTESFQRQQSLDLWRHIRLAPGIELHVSLEAESSGAEMIDGIQEYVQQFHKQQTRRNKS